MRHARHRGREVLFPSVSTVMSVTAASFVEQLDAVEWWFV